MRWAADSILSDSVDVDTGDVGGGDATRPSLQNRFHLFLSQGQSSAASALVSESEKETPEDSERGREKKPPSPLSTEVVAPSRTSRTVRTFGAPKQPWRCRGWSGSGLTDLKSPERSCDPPEIRCRNGTPQGLTCCKLPVRLDQRHSECRGASKEPLFPGLDSILRNITNSHANTEGQL